SAIKKFEKSKKYYDKADSIFINSLGKKNSLISLSLTNRSTFYYRMDNYPKALSCVQKSLIARIGNFNDTSIYGNPDLTVLPDLDLIYILKFKARLFYELALSSPQNINYTKYLKTALHTWECTANFIEQLRTDYLYEASKLILAKNEHKTYLGIINTAQLLFKTTADSVYVHKAFKYAELSKYSVLRELQNDQMLRGAANIADSVNTKEQNIRLRISELRTKITQTKESEKPNKAKIDTYTREIVNLTQQLENLLQTLEVNYPEYYKQKYNTQTVSIRQLQKSISPRDIIIEYTLSDSVLYTFTISKDTFALSTEPVDSVFFANLDFYQKALHSEHSTSYYKYRDATYGLYRKLIYPIENKLQNKRLLIIPDDKLSLISFETLIDKPYSENDLPDYRRESYLLRKYPIAYAYSATLYKNSLHEKKQNPHFLGIAPSYKNSLDSLPDLPLSMSSVRKISTLSLGKALTKNKASVNNFRKYSNKYDIIHFYAHGFEDTLNPSNSKLCLSHTNDTVSSSYLHAWEIYNMQLNAQLVVLASCYSGAGKISQGEGVLSISRSFINAGSLSVISSLWAASYKPTITILNYFYINLLKGMRKDEALRLAKLKYLDQTDSISGHPRFWAGIIINGNQLALYKNWYLNKIISLLVISLAILILIRYLRKRKRKLKNLT
ncbi:MAG: CHAT domain-containing protein, partial [Bacteroidales bacterium]|nr:CHAT domain-containing protein [Bacteroidales bacterium]